MAIKICKSSLVRQDDCSPQQRRTGLCPGPDPLHSLSQNLEVKWTPFPIYLLNPLDNRLRALLGLLYSLGQVNPEIILCCGPWLLWLMVNCPPAVQAELLARHDHAPHPPVGLAPAGCNGESVTGK